MKEITITCDLKDSLKLSEFTDLQPTNFKEMSVDSYQKFRLSMLKDGFHEPIKVWRDNGINYIVDGHHRIKILKKFLDEGYKIPLIPCYYVQCKNRKDAIKMLLASNSHYAIIIDEELNKLLTVNKIDLDIFDTIDLTGHRIDTDVFLQQFHKDVEVEKDADEIPEIDEENIITKLGDMWTLGRHRLLCDDCTVRENVDRLMDGDKADMVFTDPPYGMNLDTDYTKLHLASKMMGNKIKRQKFNKVIGDNDDFNPLFLMEYFKDVKEQFWFGADYYAERILDKNKGSWLVWDKRKESQDEGFGSGFELIWSKKKHKRLLLRHNWFGFLGQPDAKNRMHPTQKPIALLRDILERYSKANEIAVDPFLGSGTTIIAAEKTKRVCYGMEIDEHYCDVIIKRYVDFTDDDPVRQDGVKWSELIDG